MPHFGEPSVPYLVVYAPGNIQGAINSLTAGRTWKERVCLKGDFIITDATPLPIRLPSYTILDLRKARILDNRTATIPGKWDNLIENADLVAGNSHIEIWGGIIDGQRGAVAAQDEEGVGYNSTHNAILFENVTDSKVIGTFIYNMAGNAIGTMAGQRNKFVDVYGENCCGYGIFEYTGEVDTKTIRCHAKDGDVGVGAAGFNTCTVTERCDFIECKAEANGFDGFVTSPDDTELLFIGCKAWENQRNGIYLARGVATVVDCWCWNNSQAGAGSYDGISVARTDVILIGNRCWDDQGVKTQRYGIYCAHAANEHFLIIGNNCIGNQHATLDITWTGQGAMVYNNKGRVLNKGVIAAPGVPATGVALPNTYGAPMDVYVDTTGNVTNIAVNGTNTNLTSGLFHLEPGDTITIVYVAAPAWVWVGN